MHSDVRTGSGMKKHSSPQMIKPEMLRVMNYYQSKFNGRVDSLINRSIMHSRSKASILSQTQA